MMTACNSRSYLDYIYKSVDKYNNPYHHSIGKERIDTKYSALTEKIETNSEVPKIKVVARVRTAKYKYIFSKSYPNNWSREIFAINSMMKTNPWTY